jgi:hypothetical protein
MKDFYKICRSEFNKHEALISMNMESRISRLCENCDDSIVQILQEVLYRVRPNNFIKYVADLKFTTYFENIYFMYIQKNGLQMDKKYKINKRKIPLRVLFPLVICDHDTWSRYNDKKSLPTRNPEMCLVAIEEWMIITSKNFFFKTKKELKMEVELSITDPEYESLKKLLEIIHKWTTAEMCIFKEAMRMYKKKNKIDEKINLWTLDNNFDIFVK